jgi:hypothetical protein
VASAGSRGSSGRAAVLIKVKAFEFKFKLVVLVNLGEDPIKKHAT